MSDVRKKTVLLDQGLLRQAQLLLGSRTETEAITKALEELVQRRLQAEAVLTLHRFGPFDPERV